MAKTSPDQALKDLIAERDLAVKTTAALNTRLAELEGEVESLLPFTKFRELASVAKEIQLLRAWEVKIGGSQYQDPPVTLSLWDDGFLLLEVNLPTGDPAQPAHKAEYHLWGKQMELLEQFINAVKVGNDKATKMRELQERLKPLSKWLYEVKGLVEYIM